MFVIQIICKIMHQYNNNLSYRVQYPKDPGVDSGLRAGVCGCSSCAVSHLCWSDGWVTCCLGSLREGTRKVCFSFFFFVYETSSTAEVYFYFPYWINDINEILFKYNKMRKKKIMLFYQNMFYKDTGTQQNNK